MLFKFSNLGNIQWKRFWLRVRQHGFICSSPSHWLCDLGPVIFYLSRPPLSQLKGGELIIKQLPRRFCKNYIRPPMQNACHSAWAIIFIKCSLLLLGCCLNPFQTISAFSLFHHAFLIVFHLKNTYLSQRIQKSLISDISELEDLKTLLRPSVSSSADERTRADGFQFFVSAINFQ